MLRLGQDTGGVRRIFRTSLLVFVALCIIGAVASGHPCKHTRDFGKSSTSGHVKWSAVVGQPPFYVNCSSRDIIRIPTNIDRNATRLDLSRNRISRVRTDDFVNVPNLRVLDLSYNSIRTLESRCFRRLGNLERLDLNDNNMASLSPDVFVGLQSLRVLTMNGLPLTSYQTEFVQHTRELRVLSLSAVGDATIPAEYARLPRLKVLDFYKDTIKLTKITAAMFDNIRDSDITTLSFRNMNRLQEVEAGAFSDMSSTQSLILAFNKRLSFRKTVAALAASTDTTVDTVVLDGASNDIMTVFDESDFCSSFWRRVRRLSVRGTSLLGFVFGNTRCLSQLRELVVDYNSPVYVQPVSPDLPTIFPNLKTLSLSHRTLDSRAYYHAYGPSRESVLDADDYFPTRPPVLPTQILDDTNTCNNSKYLHIPMSLEFLHMSDVRSTPRLSLNESYCFGNVRYLNVSHNKFAKVLCDGCRIIGNNRLEIIDLSNGALEAITSEFFNFPRLRFLNLSNNALGASGSDFRETFSHLIRLEDINLSGNRLRDISPQAFERCKSLRRLNLANNELAHIELNIRHLTSLEYIDLSDNYLMRLSDTFMATLDQQFQVRPFEISIQSYMFMCNCESASFVRWTLVTHVRLTDKDRLTCLYRGDRTMKLGEIALDKIGKKCSFPWKPVIIPIVVGLLISVTVFALFRYHRWYVLHQLVPRHLPGTMASTYVQEKQHKAVLIYLRSGKSRGKQSGFARILSRDDNNILPLAEEKLGLNIHDVGYEV